MLCRVVLVLQAAGLDGHSFDVLPPLQNFELSPKIGVCRSDVRQALMEAAVVVLIDEGRDLGFQVSRQEVVFQQDAVLENGGAKVDHGGGGIVLLRAA